jgi:hypothetical protein
MVWDPGRGVLPDSCSLLREDGLQDAWEVRYGTGTGGA